MRRVWLTLAALAALAVVGGAAVVGLGLYNVSARAGHLPGVSWVLHTTYRNAVELRAPPRSEVPELDAERVALGARHFASACAMCHAAPGETRSATARALVPEPPHIAQAVKDWEPRHLHWIVYNGVKMSGMPGWPAKRPEEVWSLVAFLDRVGAMAPEEYRALVAEKPQEGVVGYCAGCHGIDGRTENPHIPRLDIQNETYLLSALEAYHDERRQSGIMSQAATMAGRDALPRLAAHYGRVTPEPLPQGPVSGDVIGGRKLAAGQAGSGAVPACAACHGPDATRASPYFPALGGQHEAYLAAQLRLWRDGLHGGGKRADLMHEAARELTDADIADLSAYYASLPPEKLAP